MSDSTPEDSAPIQQAAAPVSPAAKPAAASVHAPKRNKIRKPVGAATFRRRHLGLILSFFLIVVLPVSAATFYMLLIAKDQYSSLTGFTVRKEEGSSASSLLGGLAGLAGSSGASDGDILYKFIHSQALIRSIDENIGLRDHYGAYWSGDPVFALKPGASIEDLESYWNRVVRVSYDKGSGLTELRVQAFTPEKAREVAIETVRLSQNMINALNEHAREDAMRYARSDLTEALARLKASREALTTFRSTNQIVDPESDIQGRMGVMNNLQQQLAESLIQLDLLTGSTSEGDPRLRQAERLITVIRERIASERSQLSSGGSQEGGTGDDYPRLIAEYEGLVVDRVFAEENYRAALAALDLARANASRQSRYLATYIEPTLAQTSEYPRRMTIIGMVILFLTLGWSIMALVYYSIRDRS